MKTNFYCVFALYDTTAAEDSTVTTDYNQSFGNAEYLPDGVSTTDYATLEEDFFLLDGSFTEMPDDPEDVVFMSSVLSDANGNFSTNPTIEISFTENHSSIGLTFYFLDDPPTGMTVYWYDSGGTLLKEAAFEIDSNEYYASQQVEDYRKLIIEFTSALPYRYVKLRYLEYGKTISFGANGYGIEGASSADLAHGGRGECELQYIIGDVVVKSCIWQTRIMPALKEPGEAPPAETGWVSQMLASIAGRTQEMIATGLYCGFELDPESGILYMITADGYGGLTFELNDNGYLEVVI